MDVKKASEFIKRSARPLELAEFRCHFENGSKQAVIEALRPYQNPDGGFGHGLEPDNWNPNSTPITTNDALIHLFETGALPEAGGMAEAMVRYLTSGQARHPETGRWYGSIESNRDYPHAIWWEPSEEDVLPGWNPTVSLAACLVCMGEGGPWKRLVQEAFAELEAAGEKSGDGLKCFMLAWRLLKAYGVEDVIDFDAARKAVQASVRQNISPEIEKYGVEYVTTPSWFFQGDSPLLPEGMEPFIQAELKVLDSLQKEDGGFDISWQWYTPYEKEFQQARAWWRPRVTMEKLRFYRQCGA